MAIQHTADDERRMVVAFLRANGDALEITAKNEATALLRACIHNRANMAHQMAGAIERGDHKSPIAMGEV